MRETVSPALRVGPVPMRKETLAGLGGVVAALLGSLCCVGPLLFVALGIGAGLASTFEPLRPLFGILMLSLLWLGFYLVYSRRPVAIRATEGDGAMCSTGSACGRPRRRRRDVVLLWTASVLALVLWTFPTWSLWLL